MTLRFGAFDLDQNCRRLARQGEPVRLTPKAFDLMALLVSEAPRVVTKTEIHERIWRDTFVSDATLVGTIKELRRALDDRRTEGSVIRTVHRVGYALAPPVERIETTAALGRHWLVTGGKRRPLREGVNTIGRDPHSDVCLDPSSVSRQHAKLTVDGTGATLEDLGSKNGTMVGGSPITGRVTLRDGDRVIAGMVPLTYRTSSAGVSTDTSVGTPEKTGQTASEPVGAVRRRGR